jgi:hypothetical protein
MNYMDSRYDYEILLLFCSMHIYIRDKYYEIVYILVRKSSFIVNQITIKSVY